MIEAVERGRIGSLETERHLVVSEHAKLSRRAEQVERLLARLARGEGDRLREADVARLLDDFRIRLDAHLAREEQGGALDRVSADEPRFARRIHRLRSEHDELRGSLDAIISLAGGSRWTQLHASFVSFRRLFRAHETDENDVLLCAYLDDLGGRG